MAILNLTPDSFWEPGRFDMSVLDSGADIIDIGAVSTRPGAADVTLEEEWKRLESVLKSLRGRFCGTRGDRKGWEGLSLSIDTTRSEIVRRAYDIVGPFIVNDITAGLSDPDMLRTAGRLSLPFIAMHSRGNPRTMDSLTAYPRGFLASIDGYFADFEKRAADAGIEDWILDPGFGFAKTVRQNIYLLDHLSHFHHFGRPILVGLADKRFTRPVFLPDGTYAGRTEEYHLRALKQGAGILRVHDVDAARRTLRIFQEGGGFSSCQL